MKIGKFTAKIQVCKRNGMLGIRLTHNLISVITKSRHQVSSFQRVCFSSEHMPGFQSPIPCSQDSGRVLPETEAKELVPQKCSAGEKQLKYKSAYFTNKKMGFSPSCAASPALCWLLYSQIPQHRTGFPHHWFPAQGMAWGCCQLDTHWEQRSHALTLASVAARGPSQGQGGIRAGRGDSVQEGAGIQRCTAPAGPGQDVPIQPHGPGQRLPQLPQQFQRRSHGGQAVPGHRVGHGTGVSPQCHCSVTARSLPGRTQPSTRCQQLPSPAGAKHPDSHPCSQHFQASPHPPPCHLSITGLRRVLTKEGTAVSNTCVSPHLEATNAVNSAWRVKVISPHLNHTQSGKDFITAPDPDSKLPSHLCKVMCLYQENKKSKTDQFQATKRGKRHPLEHLMPGRVFFHSSKVWQHTEACLSNVHLTANYKIAKYELAPFEQPVQTPCKHLTKSRVTYSYCPTKTFKVLWKEWWGTAGKRNEHQENLSVTAY